MWPIEAVELVREMIEGARPAWHAEAACRSQGVDQWFPERGASLDPARAVCASCPVRGECLDTGLDERFGVWGNTSERERRKLRRQRWLGDAA